MFVKQEEDHAEVTLQKKKKKKGKIEKNKGKTVAAIDGSIISLKSLETPAIAIVQCFLISIISSKTFPKT